MTQTHTNRPPLPDRTGVTRSPAASEFPPHSPPPQHSVTSHGMEYPALFGQVGSAPTPRLCPFLEFGEN